MSRYRDVWIVLALAAFACWRNWERIESELASAVEFVMPESLPAEIAETDPPGLRVIDVEFQVPTPPPPRFDVYWTSSAAPFDCSRAPAGCVIIHDDFAPACGMPMPRPGH